MSNKQYVDIGGAYINLDNVVMVLPTELKIYKDIESVESPSYGSKICFIGGQSYDIDIPYEETKLIIDNHIRGIEHG